MFQSVTDTEQEGNDENVQPEDKPKNYLTVILGRLMRFPTWPEKYYIEKLVHANEFITNCSPPEIGQAFLSTVIRLDVKL